MNPGTPFRPLVKQILEDARQNIDLLPQRRGIIPRPDGVLAVVNDKLEVMGEFEPTAHAHGQLAQAMGFPTAFYHRMRSKHGEEWSRSLFALLAEQPEERRMLRTRGGSARAFLSSKYRRLDNDAVAAMVLPVIEQRGLMVKSCEVTETRLYLQLVTPRVEAEIRKGDVVQAGIVISNSEVGAATLSVKPLIYRLVCTNGMIADTESKVYRHLGGRLQVTEASGVEILTDQTRAAQDEATMMAVRDLVDHFTSAQGFQGIVDRIKEVADQPIKGQATDVVEVLGKSYGLREGEVSGVLEAFLGEGDRTRWGLANAVTYLANTHEDYDRAIELEAVGGEVMALQGRDWNALALAGL